MSTSGADPVPRRVASQRDATMMPLPLHQPQDADAELKEEVERDSDEDESHEKCLF